MLRATTQQPIVKQQRGGTQGFYFLLGWLGFEIVPKDDVTTAARSGSMSAMSAPGSSFLAQDASPELDGAPTPQADDDQKTIIVKSPFRRGG